MSKKESAYKFQGTGLPTKEKNWAKNRFEEYRQNNTIERLSDLQLLEELVIREAYQERYKQKIGDLNKLSDKEKDPKKKALIPGFVLKAMNENLEVILKLKDTLNLLEAKKDNDPFEYIQQLKKKFEIWRKENPNRYITCPHCSKNVLLKIRTDKYEAIKHPFYHKNVLYNEHAFKMLDEGKIKKEDVEKILLGEEAEGTDYTDWLLKQRKSTSPSSSETK